MRGEGMFRDNFSSTKWDKVTFRFHTNIVQVI